jgi:hypothetical protein
MSRLLKHLLDKYPTELFVYMDNILIATDNDLERHQQIVHKVLDLLEEESYFLRPTKCEFEQCSITYLGIIVNCNQLKPDPKKTSTLRDWPQTLHTVKEVRSILRVLGYQHPFIPNYANIACPLVTPTKKDHPFLWTLECTKALNTLISIILDNPVLQQLDSSANKADTLSRVGSPNYPQGPTKQKITTNVTVLPAHLFACAAMFSSIDDRAHACQLQQMPLLKQRANTFPLKVINDLYWYRDRLVVMDDLPLRRGVISLYHNFPSRTPGNFEHNMGHCARDYWWPNMKQTITDYVKGCHLCQSRKNNPTKPKPPLFPIPSDNFTLPFTSVAMDFIVKLPISEGYDSILTITDTFSKACIFIPCNETIDTAGTALLYTTYVLPHYGLPSCFISDCNPCFMATIIQELCCILSIQHNASTAYHPQTDRQSEHSNQKLEQYMCIFTNFHQTNWCSLLPLAQFAFNAWPNTTTKKAPFKLIMGHIPCVHQTFRITTSPPLNN